MRQFILELGAASMLCLSLGCSRTEPIALPIGAEGGPCTVGGGCDPGLICLSRLCVRPPDSAIPSSVGGVGGHGTGGRVGTGGQAGVGGLGGTGGSGGRGGAIPTGGAGGRATGGAGGHATGGVGGRATGGAGGRATGGAAGRATGGNGGRATGGAGGRATGGAGGRATGGAGGASCTNVVPCGGDVVGTWTVTSSCLNLSGEMDVALASLGCPTVPVTGSLQVSGTWTANGNGTYADNTTTTGTATFPLDKSCLSISSVPVECSKVAGIFVALGWATSVCSTDASGTCRCALTAKQSGGLGVVSPWASSSGTYTTSGNALNIDDMVDYSYCVSGNTLTVTPKPTILPVTGRVVLQQGGVIGTGGAGGSGGSAGSGGSTAPSSMPCDIYAADGGPCVAAHSTVRRLSSSYAGPLYQVRAGGAKSGTGGTTTDIGFLADGFADAFAQDMACGEDPCTISIIYDQSGLGNHLTVAPAGGAKMTPDNEANAKANPITIGSHQAYGLRITPGVGYRNNRAVGTATGDDPETIYMVASGELYNAACCFDYGNAETNSRDNGEGTVEAVYFGNCTIWNRGGGDGPWVMADLENGLWAGNTSVYEENTSIDYVLVTGMVKGDAKSATHTDGHWSIKVGNAQSGGLATRFDGPRPNSRYNPMKKEGAIILGTAGDNSNADQGVFFEGVMTAHYSSNAADDAVQASIVATYGQ